MTSHRRRHDAAIAVHGGAFDIPRDEWLRHREGCLAAARAGWQVLEDGGSALDAVEPAVRELEGSRHLRRRPRFGPQRGRRHRARRRDHGRRRARRRLGRRRCRASRTPITLARRVLESPFAVFAGDGVAAVRRAGRGRDLRPGRDRVRSRERARWEDARAASPTRTGWRTMFGRHGGRGRARPGRQPRRAAPRPAACRTSRRGRVGDSPFIGAGLYADNETRRRVDDRPRRADHPARAGQGGRRPDRRRAGPPGRGRRRSRPSRGATRGAA